MSSQPKYPETDDNDHVPTDINHVADGEAATDERDLDTANRDDNYNDNDTETGLQVQNTQPSDDPHEIRNERQNHNQDHGSHNDYLVGRSRSLQGHNSNEDHSREDVTRWHDPQVRGGEPVREMISPESLKEPTHSCQHNHEHASTHEQSTSHAQTSTQRQAPPHHGKPPSPRLCACADDCSLDTLQGTDGAAPPVLPGDLDRNTEQQTIEYLESAHSILNSPVLRRNGRNTLLEYIARGIRYAGRSAADQAASDPVAASHAAAERVVAKEAAAALAAADLSRPVERTTTDRNSAERSSSTDRSITDQSTDSAGTSERSTTERSDIESHVPGPMRRARRPIRQPYGPSPYSVDNFARRRRFAVEDAPRRRRAADTRIYGVESAVQDSLASLVADVNMTNNVTPDSALVTDGAVDTLPSDGVTPSSGSSTDLELTPQTTTDGGAPDGQTTGNAVVDSTTIDRSLRNAIRTTLRRGHEPTLASVVASRNPNESREARDARHQRRGWPRGYLLSTSSMLSSNSEPGDGSSDEWEDWDEDDEVEFF